jgi:acyl-CoA hydrolase
MLTDRVRYKPLQKKICNPSAAVDHIQDGTNLFISGFTAGYPKLIPRELVRRAENGEHFKINQAKTAFKDDHLSQLSAKVRADNQEMCASGFPGPVVGLLSACDPGAWRA